MKEVNTMKVGVILIYYYHKNIAWI